MSCTDKSDSKPNTSVGVFVTEAPTEQDLTAQLAQRGKSVYNLNCIACHNSDPSKDGSTGPSLRGSSRELLDAKILRATYPGGYKSKRDTKLMPALPHLAKEISALEAYLR